LPRHEQDAATIDPNIINWLMSTAVAIEEHCWTKLSKSFERIANQTSAAGDLRRIKKILGARRFYANYIKSVCDRVETQLYYNRIGGINAKRLFGWREAEPARLRQILPCLCLKRECVLASPIGLTCQNRSNITVTHCNRHAAKTDAVSTDDLNDNGDLPCDGRLLGERHERHQAQGHQSGRLQQATHAQWHADGASALLRAALA
jgi:hypothetical protein